MAAREILQLGDPLLHRICEPVLRDECDGLATVVEDLRDTLYAFRANHGSGRAIAAPQIGVLKRLVYMEVREPVVFINPELQFPDEEMVELWDDCMSFPNLLVRVRRYRRCRISYSDLSWTRRELSLENDLSELLQHECDHLDGILATARAVDGRAFAFRSELHRSSSENAVQSVTHAIRSLPASAQRVQDALRAYGAEFTVLQLPDSARTAKQAADAIGCSVAQIAKSLVFRQKASGEPLLVIASGTNRVSEERVGEIVGQQVVMADAEMVRAVTGFAIGGVPPVAHRETIPTLVDADLFRFDQIWAAAGTPHSVFALDPKELPRMTGGKVVSVT